MAMMVWNEEVMGHTVVGGHRGHRRHRHLPSRRRRLVVDRRRCYLLRRPSISSG
jgi:hypothetical protein